MDQRPALDSMQEIDAMKTVAHALDPCTRQSRRLILAWAASLYGLRLQGVAPPVQRQSGEASGVSAASVNDLVAGFGSLAEFFDAGDPQTEGEKALIGGFWLQRREGMATFDSAAVNRELKNLGHAVTNITMAFDWLMDQKPALAVQTAKSGKSRQARKK